ncbi:uncharacterized protein LOC100185810 isoform X2 [Ciona intestinalis]
MKVCVVLFVALVAILTSPYLTEACTCSPEHPQHLFCKSDYVVKVLIMSKKDVIIEEDGTIIDIEPEKEELPEKDVTLLPEDFEEVLTTTYPPETAAPAPVQGEVPEEEGGEVEEPTAEEVVGEVGEPTAEEQGGEQPRGDQTGGDETGGLPEEVEVVITDISEVASDQPAVKEEASEDPGTGREIVWPHISTSSEQRVPIVGPIETQPSGGAEVPQPVVPELVVVDDVTQDGEEALISPDDVNGAESAASIRVPRYAYRNVGPDGAMPGSKRFFVGIRGKPLGLAAQDGAPGSASQNLLSGRNKRNIIRRNAPPGLIRPSNDIPSVRLNPNDFAIRVRTHTQYKIRIMKVFKGDVSNDTMYLYTPPSSSLCRMHLNLKTPYVIMGSIRDGRLHVSYCNYKIDASTLKRVELRHLTSTIKHRFTKACRDCRVNICNNEPCPEMSEVAGECNWRNIYTLRHRKANEFACVRKKSGKCDWYNALHPNMRPDDLDEEDAVDSP